MSEKINSLHFYILEAGTYTSSKYDAAFFDQLPALTELEIDPVSQPIVTENSFLDQSSILDIPALEEIPMTELEVPSFLYDPPSQRDCTRKLRSSRVNSRAHPFNL